MHRKAIRHLKRIDPVLAGIIERVGPYRLRRRDDDTHFSALVRAIVYQQLSGKAAGTIHARFLALYGERHPSADELLATEEERLRGVGLSRQKTTYLRDLAAHVSSGSLPLEAIETLDDDEIIERLVRVKGIGKWTAQMFLMFRLQRPDVLPDLDLGIQNAIHRAYGLRARPTPKDVLRIGARWSPYASFASWYLWRSLDVETPEGSAIARSGEPAATAPAAGGPPPTSKVRRGGRPSVTGSAPVGSVERSATAGRGGPPPKGKVRSGKRSTVTGTPPDGSGERGGSRSRGGPPPTSKMRPSDRAGTTGSTRGGSGKRRRSPATPATPATSSTPGTRTSGTRAPGARPPAAPSTRAATTASKRSSAAKGRGGTRKRG